MNVSVKTDQPMDIKAKPAKKQVRWTRLLFLLPALVYVALIYVYPIVFNIIMSFGHYSLKEMIQGSAPFVGFENYVRIFTNPLTPHILLNTLIFAVGSIVFQFSIGLALAVFLNRYFPLSQLIRTLLLIPWLMPLIVTASAFRWMFQQSNGIFNQLLLNLHLIHHPLGWLIMPHLALAAVIITNIWVGIPFNMVLLYGGLQDIPGELYEAAAIDGAGWWKSFLHITIPSLRPVISIVLMLGIVYTLKVFDVIKILTDGGPANSTQVLSTWSYTLSFNNYSFGEGAVVGNIMIVIALFFAVIYLRSARQS